MIRVAMIGQKGIPATYGGIERHVEELGRRLAARGIALDVYCRTHYTPDEAEVEGIDLIRLPSVYTKHLDAITHVALSSVHAAMARADIVHFHALGPSSLAWIPRLTRKKIVVTVHGLDWQREKWGAVATNFLRFCERPATGLAHATVVVSKTLREHFESRGHRRIHYIPNGTPLPPQADDTPLEEWGVKPEGYLLFVGRLVPEKGLHHLVRAHRRFVPEVPLLIAGAGHFTDDYVDSCKADANERVQFLGPVYEERLAALQQHARLVVVPSSLEGLSIALLEAMSYGRAVLGSDIPENLEVLDGVGASFRVGNEEDLGEKLGTLLNRPDHLDELGLRARARIEEEYDWERVADRTATLYRGLAGGE